MKIKWHTVAIVLFFIGALLFGISVYHSVEGWGYLDSTYFLVITATTIGYGDLVPSHDISKLVATIYAVLSIPIAFFAFGIIAENYFEIRLARLERRMMEMVARERDIEKAVDDNNKSKKEKDEK